MSHLCGPLLLVLHFSRPQVWAVQANGPRV
jgi:hypothetical protein